MKSTVFRMQGCILLTVLALLITASPAAAQGLFHNQRIFVTPAPGRVRIDGKLKDWDLSGEIYTYVIEATSAFQSAKTAMMYDNKALYISSRVADPSPMLNSADPKVNPDFGWDGDAFQLRLNLDPNLGYPLKIGGYDRHPSEMLVHMTLWYHAASKKAVLHCKYGMNYHDAHGYHKGVVPAKKFKAVYVPWKNGKGYTFEYRIPWTTLGAPRPLKGGDLTAAAIQMQWSDATGKHSYGGGWAVDVMSHAGFTYQSTGSWGKAIFAEKGKLPKELTQEGVPPVRKLPLKFQFRLPKEQVASISLFNNQGDLVCHVIAAGPRPAGKITESWDGLDSAGRVLPPGDYTWKGVYHDPLKVKYVMGVGNSGSPSYNTPDGKGAWGGDWGYPADVCFAGNRGVLLWDGSEAGMGVIGIDDKGRKQWGYRIGGSHLATDGDWVYVYLNHEKQLRAYGVKDGRQINFTRGELWAEHNAMVLPTYRRGAKVPAKPRKIAATLCTGMAWQDKKLYVANAAANEIIEYDARQGKIRRRLPVPAPTGIGAAGKGQLLVISRGAVAKLTIANGKLAPFINDHLDMPHSVAAGPDGSVYVGNHGKRMNVSVYDQTGKYLRWIGKPGGRAITGPMQEAGTVSNARAGKWDPNTLLNPQGLAVDAKGRLWVMEHDYSPKRISVWEPATAKLVDEKFGPCFVSTPVCMDPADPTRVYTQNVEWEVDLKKRTWKPGAVMFEAKPDTPYFWPHMVNNIVFTAKNGKQYMHHKSYQRAMVIGQYLWIRRGDHFEAAAGLIAPQATLSWRPGVSDWREVRKVSWLLWEDRNGNGVIEQAETRQTKMQAHNSHSVFDADLNMYATGMYNYLYWQRIKVKRILPNGVPIYDDESLKTVEYARTGYTYDLTVNPNDGSLLMYAGADIKHLDRTEVWPITYWSANGKREWRYRVGCRWHDMYEFPIPKAGELYGCTKNIGITDGITGYSCYFGQVQLLTTDGVVIGTIMKDGRSGEVGPDQIQCEWFTGQLVKLKNGRWYLLGGDQDGRVLEVVGLNSLKRFEGKLRITPRDARAAAKALAEWTALKAKAQSLVLSRCPTKPDWKNIRGIKIEVDQKRGFTVKAAYNATHLIIHYQVNSPNELTNSTPERNLVFKGGNLLDIQLACNPEADPERKTPAPGDIRVLVSRRQGKPFAVAYRPKVAGFRGQPTVFTSPTGKESFDRIEFWEDVKLDYQKTPTGFIAVVSLPLAKLGLTPKPGTLQKMDLGYIFGNQTGNTTATRSYWSNNSFSSRVTQDVPNEARLEPARWGSATVE